MLKFYVEKSAEGETRPAFKDILEFETFEDFLQWANYNRNYIKEVKTLDENSTYAFYDLEGNVVSDYVEAM